MDQPKLELSFEYLLSKDKLQWITVHSSQVIFLSLCLQSMVEELMRKNGGGYLNSCSQVSPGNPGCTLGFMYVEKFERFSCLVSSFSWPMRLLKTLRSWAKTEPLCAFLNPQENQELPR